MWLPVTEQSLQKLASMNLDWLDLDWGIWLCCRQMSYRRLLLRQKEVSQRFWKTTVWWLSACLVSPNSPTGHYRQALG